MAQFVEDTGIFLPLDFYKLPEDSPCWFSTDFGRKPKRSLSCPFPSPIVHSNYNSDCHTMVTELQRLYPEQIWDIEKPNQWHDLHRYFDAVDLYTMGPEFLLNVVTQVSIRNNDATAKMNRLLAEAAYDWVSHHQQLVRELSLTQDLIHFIEPMELDGMKPREVNLYNLALHGQRQLLLGRLANNQYVAPNDDQHVGVVTGPAGLPVPADPLSCAAMGADVVRPATAFNPPGGALVRKVDVSSSRINVARVGDHASQHTGQPGRRYSHTTQGTRARRLSNTNLKPSSSSTRQSFRRRASTPTGLQADTVQPYNFREKHIVAPRNQPVLIGSSSMPPSTRFQSGLVFSPSQQFQYLPNVANPTLVPNPAFLNAAAPSPQRTLPTQDVRFFSRKASFEQSSSSWRPFSSYRSRQISSDQYQLPMVGSPAIASATMGYSAPPLDNQMNGGMLPTAYSRDSAPMHTELAFDTNPLTTGETVFHSSHQFRYRTIIFNGLRLLDNRDVHGNCTVLIKHVAEAVFCSHGFKRLLDQFGFINSISMIDDGEVYGKQTGLIHYSGAGMANNAIRFLQNFSLADGSFFTHVGIAPKKLSDFSKNIQHHGSFAFNSHNHQPVYSQKRGRRPSVYNQSRSYRPHQYSNQESRAHSHDRREALTDGFTRQLELSGQYESTAQNTQRTSVADPNSEQPQNSQNRPTEPSTPRSARRKKATSTQDETVRANRTDDSRNVQVNSASHKKENKPPKHQENSKSVGKYLSGQDDGGTTQEFSKAMASKNGSPMKKQHNNDQSPHTKPALKIDTNTMTSTQQRRPHSGLNKRSSRTTNSPSTVADSAPASFTSNEMSRGPSTTSHSSFMTATTVLSSDVSGIGETVENEKLHDKVPIDSSSDALTTGSDNQLTAGELQTSVKAESPLKSRKNGKLKSKKSSTALSSKSSTLSTSNDQNVPTDQPAGSGGSGVIVVAKTNDNQNTTNKANSRQEPQTKSKVVKPLKLGDDKEFPSLDRSDSPQASIADGIRPDPPRILTPGTGSPVRKSRNGRRAADQKKARSELPAITKIV